MGVVHLARDVWLEREVALKVISPSRSADDVTCGRFLDEAKALAAVMSRHVVQIYAFGVHDESCFLAMERIRGKSLRALIVDHAARGVELPVSEALAIVSKIASGLDAVHAAGIVHRDVKPPNILIEEGAARPVLIDFGLATASGVVSADGPCGTPRYMAPEQLRGGMIGPWTDVYALGCVAFELLTGCVPFATRDVLTLVQDIQKTPAPRASSMKPERAGFDEVLGRALEKRGADRYGSCVALARALEAAAAACSFALDEPFEDHAGADASAPEPRPASSPWFDEISSRQRGRATAWPTHQSGTHAIQPGRRSGAL